MYILITITKVRDFVQSHFGAPGKTYSWVRHYQSHVQYCSTGHVHPADRLVNCSCQWVVPEIFQLDNTPTSACMRIYVYVKQFQYIK